MGDALFDLEQALHSSREKLTIQESNIFLAWKARAMRDFTIGFGGGSIVTWLATRKINRLVRCNIVLGAAGICGLVKFQRSVESSVDRVLSLEGSRIQQELANIMLKRYNCDPWVLKHHHKHFYSEEVYDDSTSDQPVFRWRFKHCNGDPIDFSESKSSTDETITKKNEVKRVQRNLGQSNVIDENVTFEDPYDIMFGTHGSGESSDATPSTMSSRERRKERRSHRRHRRHHHEDDSDV